MQVDHIIPESLLENKKELADALLDFGLPSNFDLNSYSNWMPSCSGCNRSKSNSVFNPSPLIQRQIETAAGKAQKSSELAEKSASKREITKALNTLERAHTVEGLSDEVKSSLQPLIAFQEQERSSENIFYGLTRTAANN
jgi:hypothetical protein